MATTLEDLEKRVAALEQVVAGLKRQANGSPMANQEEVREQFPNTKCSQAEFAEGWAKAMEHMGIQGQPIGPENLQKMLAAAGIKPEKNEFSRGIIEMREE